MEEDVLQNFFDDNHTPLLNIGYGEDLTINEIASIVSEVVGYKGNVSWDLSKPDGTLQKLLDISKVNELGWKPNIDLKNGIRSVYEWYMKE
jgi:GDP-L-fucose synthase